MSIFCGKCDVFDTLIGIREMTDESDWSKVKIYQYNDKNERILLDIRSTKDLLPYAAHLIESSCSCDGDMTACITSRSYVDIENDEHMFWLFKMAKREYMRCKRKGVTFDIENAAKKISFRRTPGDVEKTICERIAEHPYAKANISDLKSSTYYFYKEMLEKAMIEAGYTAKQAHVWCYYGKKIW